MFEIKKKLLLLALLPMVLCAVVLIVFGQTYTVKLSEEYLSQPIPADTSVIRVEIENEDAGAEITDYSVKDGALIIRFSSVMSMRINFSSSSLLFSRRTTEVELLSE